MTDFTIMPRKIASHATRLSRIKASKKRYELRRPARASLKVGVDLYRRFCRLRDERGLGESNEEFLTHLLVIYEEKASTSNSEPASSARSAQVHLESTYIIDVIEKANMEAIQKETSDLPQPSEQQGYQTFMIKEEILDEDSAESNNAEHLSEEPWSQGESQSRVCFDSSTREDGAGWREDNDHKETLEDGERTEGVSVHHAETVHEEHYRDGCGEGKGGKDMTSQPSDETHIDYQTIECYIKKEPLDSDCSKDFGNSSSVGMVPPPLCEQAQNSNLDGSCMGSTLQISADVTHRSDDGLSPKAELGIQSDSSKGGSSTTQNSSLESSCVESTLQISADGIHHSDDSPPSHAELHVGIQSDLSRGESSSSGNASQDNINGSIRSVQEMPCDRLSGEKHSEDFYARRDSGTLSHSSEKDSHLCEYPLNHTSNCTFGPGEKSIVKVEMPDSASSDLIHGGINTKHKTNNEGYSEKDEEEGLMTSVHVPSYQLQLPVESLSTPMPAAQQPQAFHCPICSKQYSREDTVSRHMKTHPEEGLYPCLICGKQFFKKSVIVRHMKIHREKGRHRCTRCGKAFANIRNLNKHRALHSGEKLIKCRICNEEFCYTEGLLVHMKTHPGEEPYQCSICRNVFTRKESLTRHMRSHAGYKPVTCSFCGKGFSSNQRLERHMTTHTGVKAYPCSFCGKRYAHEYSLTEHMRTHTGQKPYECAVCGKKFALNSGLFIHKKTHSGEKPHHCDVCGKTFPNSSNLFRHKRLICKSL